MNPTALSRYLGMFSLVIGGLELAAPGALSRRLGLPGGSWLVRGFGLRELAAGVTVLKDPSSLAGPAVRVAGGVMDVATLVPALLPGNPRRGAAWLAFAAVAGMAVLDGVCLSGLMEAERRRAATARRTRWTHRTA